jgi:hypothetical protein
VAAQGADGLAEPQEGRPPTGGASLLNDLIR